MLPPTTTIRKPGSHGGVRFLRAFSLLLCLLMALSALAPFSAFASEQERKTVRVGWYDSSYCHIDQFGRRSGIVYEYQQSIAAHTGWVYEYVEDSWANLLQMLLDGEIDLLSDVSYTEERSQSMLYSSLPMGEEAYYLFIDADHSDISSEDLSSCNGKRIGVNEGSIQARLFRDWMERYDLSPVVVELNEDEAASMHMLASGELDGYVSLDNISSAEEVTSVFKIGESEYYFTVNKDRPDLLSELNSAMTQILSEDPLYGKKLEEKYVHFTQTNTCLPAAQSHWLEEHGTIRVGYRCDYLPYCAVDEKTGELTGALRDYLTKASTSLKNADIDFEAVPYPTTNDALEALKRGEVDCAFPVNLSSHDCELEDIVTVSPIMMAGMNALMRSEDRPKLGPGRQLTVAINEGNRNYETFLKDSVPDWTVQTYDTGLDCLRAVYQKEADCTLISNYRMNDVIRLIDRYKLVSLPTGETMGLSLAVRRTDQELYSILNRIANNTPAEDMEYALLDYIHSDQKVSLSDFLRDNWLLTTGFITVVFLVILLLLNDKLKAERRAHIQRLKKEAALNRAQRQREQLRSAMDMAYTDPLTQRRNNAP